MLLMIAKFDSWFEANVEIEIYEESQGEHRFAHQVTPERRNFASFL
jgi:hypothetical protein